jgi:hypothetical protein
MLSGVRRARIKALTECNLACLAKQTLTDILSEFPDVAKELAVVAMRRLKRLRKDAKIVAEKRSGKEVHTPKARSRETIIANKHLSAGKPPQEDTRPGGGHGGDMNRLEHYTAIKQAAAGAAAAGGAGGGANNAELRELAINQEKMMDEMRVLRGLLEDVLKKSTG